ncbi:MAG: MarR family transcriptional regulator [Oscillospiraceae bacterium]|nr:MarR family transcriptional regulator [Oscillospiraceae bacterium]
MEADQLLLEQQLCFPLYAASRQLIRRYRPHLEALDLTYTQYITMLVLWEEQHVSVKTLGQRLYLDSGTLTPLLKQLERKGYLRRFRSREDERVLLVELTEAGRALRERAKPIPALVGSCLPLEPEETAELYRLLYRLLHTDPEQNQT